MFSKELWNFLIQVISSWQIILVTVVLILYFTLVSYVARVYHPSRISDFSFNSKPKKIKKEKTPVEAVPEGDDDLGLEEE
jgi:hypothetical protein